MASGATRLNLTLTGPISPPGNKAEFGSYKCELANVTRWRCWILAGWAYHFGNFVSTGRPPFFSQCRFSATRGDAARRRTRSRQHAKSAESSLTLLQLGNA